MLSRKSKKFVEKKTDFTAIKISFPRKRTALKINSFSGVVIIEKGLILIGHLPHKMG